MRWEAQQLGEDGVHVVKIKCLLQKVSQYDSSFREACSPTI